MLWCGFSSKEVESRDENKNVFRLNSVKTKTKPEKWRLQKKQRGMGFLLLVFSNKDKSFKIISWAYCAFWTSRKFSFSCLSKTKLDKHCNNQAINELAAKDCVNKTWIIYLYFSKLNENVRLCFVVIAGH